MSDILLDFEKNSLEFQLKVTESPLCYVRQQCVAASQIALAIYIPYPILLKWHTLVGMKDDKGKKLDYIDLLNFWIPGQWFKVCRKNGLRIHERLRREVSALVKKYTGKKVSGSKRKEAETKGLNLSIFKSELVLPHEIEKNLSAAEQEVAEWKSKYKNLESEKENLAREMIEALRTKVNEMEEADKAVGEEFARMEEKNKALSEYIKLLEKENDCVCHGRTIDQLKKCQTSRRFKEL
jgi:hypothetical protein